MEVVPHQNSIRINGNRRNKLTSRICHGVASSSFGPLGHVTSSPGHWTLHDGWRISWYIQRSDVLIIIPKDLLVLRFTGKPYVPLALYGAGRPDYFVGYCHYC